MAIEDNTITGIFPQGELDQMRQDAADHGLPTARAPMWDFTGDQGHFDAEFSAFVARQLESVRAGVYKIEYPELKFGRLCSANTEDDTGSEGITFTIVDSTAQVLVSRDMTTQTPMVELKTSQQTAGIVSLRLGYQYSIQEARASVFARRPISADKAMAVRENMERKLDDIIAVGDTTANLKGLLNQSSVLTYTPTVGVGGGTSFASKTADEVIIDLNAAPNQIVSSSKEIEVPDTVIFPTSVWLGLSGRRVGDGTSEMISTYYKRTVQNITKFETTYKSETLGASGTPRIMFYKNDPRRVEYALPQPFEQFAPQVRGMMVVTECHMRTAGVLYKLPQSAIYLDRV